MPETDQCLLGQDNKIRISYLEDAIQEIKADVHKIANDYSHRATSTMLRAIAIICGLLGVSVGVSVTLLAVLIKVTS